MGTWSTSISSNDLFQDIYIDFFELYNDNKSIDEITKILINNNKDTIDDPDEGNELWFAIAKAQWDCGSLNKEILNKIENIILSEEDLLRWKNSGAADAVIKKRIVYLD